MDVAIYSVTALRWPCDFGRARGVKGAVMRVLVTGGAGFIGSHLIDRLIAAGHSVICVDDLSSGAMANIDHLLAHPQFQFVRHNVTVPMAFDVDAIWNLACPASPVQYQADPVQTIRTAVLGALNVLDLARHLNCPVFQASTSEVYGDPDVHPQPESYTGNVNPIGPRACYDEGKRCAETLFFDYHRMYGVSIKVARIFNTYGPRMQPDDGRVVSNFIVHALTGTPLMIYGDGTQTRSLCYVDDLVEGALRLMGTGPEVTGPVNLGNSHELTIAELAERIIALTGSSSTISFRHAATDDPRRRCPDIACARSLLGWSADIALDDGLRRTIADFRRRLLAPA